MVLHCPCSQTTLTHADKVSSIRQPFQLAGWTHQIRDADTCLCSKHRSATSMLICASVLSQISRFGRNVLMQQALSLLDLSHMAVLSLATANMLCVLIA